MTIDCTVCQEHKDNFVNFLCNHRVCLKCYSKLIYHNHTKCPICRTDIKQLENLTELIKNLEFDITEMETNIEPLTEEKQDLVDLIDQIENEKEDMEYKLIEAENYHCK